MSQHVELIAHKMFDRWTRLQHDQVLFEFEGNVMKASKDALRLFCVMLALAIPVAVSAGTIIIIPKDGPVRIETWPQATSLNDIGGMETLSLFPTFSVGVGESLFSGISLLHPGATYATDGTSFLSIMFSPPVSESALPLGLLTFRPSDSLIPSIQQEGAFRFVEKGPDGTIEGLSVSANVPTPATVILMLSSLFLAGVSKLSRVFSRSNSTRPGGLLQTANH